MTVAETVVARRDDILAITAKHGGSNVRLFGSVARGDADEASDIDLLIDLAPGRTLFDLGAMVTELRERLEQQVDVVTEQGLRDRIWDRVLSEAKPL